MAFWNKKPKSTKNLSKQESYKMFTFGNVFFSDFGNDIYKSITARSCIRPLAEATAKLNCQVFRKTTEGVKRDQLNNRLERLITQQPNPYMNGKDFLYKVRTMYEVQNTAFIFIDKDIYGNVIGLYPIPMSNVEVREIENEILFIFSFFSSGKKLVGDLSDIAILRQDYNRKLLFGDSAINVLKQPLQLIHTTNESMSNVAKTSANLKGIIKSTKGMLSDTDRKSLQENFVQDYMNLENESGIAALDSTMEFQQLKSDGNVVNAAQMKEFRENIMRYFGVNDNIMLSNFTPDQWEAFYENRIEPFAVALGIELTNKCFTETERAFGNQIVFSGNRLMYASTATKLQFVQMVDRGVMSSNELREMMGLQAIEGGDTYVIRKEYTTTNNLENEEGGIDNDNAGKQTV